LLRPGEILSAHVGDLMFGEDALVVALRDPKTKTWMGRAQFATVRDGPTIAWMRWFLQGQPPGYPLWPGSPALFRKLVRCLLAKAGLERCGFTPASCRPGGATHYFLKGIAVEQLQFMGRWRAVATLRSYVQEAMAVLVWQQLPEAEVQRIRSRLTVSARVLVGPPPVAVSSLLLANGVSLSRRRGTPPAALRVPDWLGAANDR
jgi:hypothetical protein